MVRSLLPFRRHHRPARPRRVVPLPAEVASTSAIFLALRRMRAPLLALVVVFTVAVAGLSLTPGVDAAGNPHRLTPFESFYVMSYTATTIGFGEIPYPFTTGQRLWVTLMIYASVVGWAFSIGTLLALLQDDSFRRALAMQRFGRRVRRLRQPFHIIAGYGETGRSVGRRLDMLGKDFVVVDANPARIDQLGASDLTNSIAAMAGNMTDPAVLGLAGLDNPDCVGVLALTDDDLTNLAVVESVAMLQPDVPVIARVSDVDVESQMLEFGPQAVVNPVERFGNYLVLAALKPEVYRLVVWLTSPRDGRLRDAQEPIPHGTWAVHAKGEFRECVVGDLTRAGLDVRICDLEDGHPDVEGAVGCVIATMSDSANLAVAARVRREHPDVKLCVQQVQISSRSVLAAFAPHMLFVPTDLVARECLARIVAPRAWEFIEHAVLQEDAWAAELIALFQSRCGPRTPIPQLVTIDDHEAPALMHWLAHDDFVIGDLTRDGQDRDRHVPAVAVSLLRDDDVIQEPDPETPLRAGDRVLLFTGPGGRARVRDLVFSDAQVEYVATGRRVPETWIWRMLTGHHRTA